MQNGVTECQNVLSGVGVGGREAVRNGLEVEGGGAGEGVGALGFEEAAVVEFGVDEGDVEALVVEELC